MLRRFRLQPCTRTRFLLRRPRNDGRRLSKLLHRWWISIRRCGIRPRVLRKLSVASIFTEPILMYRTQCGLLNLSPGKVEPKECYQNCSGNPDDICGGPQRLSLFARPIPEPVANPGVNGYQSLGCYVDRVAIRVLSHSTGVPGGPSNMSVGACTAACSSRGYSLAALEYGGGMCCRSNALLAH
jgi:hypothetical protein